MTRKVSLGAVEVALLAWSHRGEDCNGDCMTTRAIFADQVLAAIRALPPEPEGVVVASGIMDAKNGLAKMDCRDIGHGRDAQVRLYVYNEAKDAVQSLDGKRVRVVIEPLGESNE